MINKLSRKYLIITKITSARVDLRYVLISLSLLKLRSPLATVTGMVTKIRSAVQTLGNVSCQLFDVNTSYNQINNYCHTSNNW